jgi:WD40 repeat protein/DNA-binding SARP family transcriptional activator
MDVQVLGPVEASVEGRPIPLGGGKPRALLAMLALNAGSTVSTERLIDGLWGEEPPASAHKLVQVYVSQLRKALAAGGDGAHIVTRRHGYELRVQPDAVDAGRFERLVAGGAPREALALWRGPPLDDVADEPFAGAEIRRLEELRLGALELAVDRDLEVGRHREVVGELEALVAAEPLRERLHAQRMLALYRCGRQADALAAYRDARSALVEAIGAEPGAELRRLHEAILRQDPSLELAAAVELPPELDAGTPMAGREADLEWLRELWRGAHGGAGRLVLVTGPRGIGKTRLAAALAGEVHRDRATVLHASGAGAPDAALAALTRAGAASRPTLLVLDDVDRVGEAVLGALDELAGRLAALPVLVLATAEDARLRADSTLCLAPLDAAAVHAVAELYSATSDEAAAAAQRLLDESGGIPKQVHRLAAESARAAAARRLDASATRAATERAGLRTAEDELAGDVEQLQTLRERAEPREVTPEAVACPFKGLASFDVDDAEFFFGRERLVAEMVARLAGAPLMGIVGPSGSGKSSALRAGLLPALAAGVLPGSENWALALLRPGEHPLRALEQAIADAAARGPLLIAVDQFEETFTACGDETERAAFVDALVASTRNQRRRARVLVAVRADFYGRCAAYPALARVLGANHVLVGPMSRDELRRAIELPAQRAGLRVEPELVDALIADVEGEPGALPLLSTALLELWQQRDDRRMRLSAYRQSGGVHRAVARLAERAYERLDPQQQETARRILLRLAGEGEGEAAVRRRVQLSELGGERVTGVLAVLADDRLVTIGEGEVEVAHEALLREWPRLRGWLEEDAEGRRVHLQIGAAARGWDAGGRDPGELYRGARLAAALDWSRAHEDDLNATEHAFLTASQDAAERSQRRLRAVLAGVATLLVLALIAGIVALDQRGNAREEANAADAQRLGARALVEPELDRSLLLARQGVALDDTVQTRGSLLAALLQSPAAIGVIRPTGQAVTSVALSPDDRTLAVGDDSGKLVFYDARTRRRLDTVEPEVDPSVGPGPDDIGVYALAFSPDGRRLAVALGALFDQEVVALDTRTHRVVAQLDIPRQRQVDALWYLPDGQAVGAALIDDPPGRVELLRLDARTGRRLGGPVGIGVADRSPPNFNLIAHVIVTADGRRLIVPEADETIVRDAESLRVLRRLPGRVGKHTGLSLSPDERTLALGRDDGSLRLVDLRSGAIRTAPGPGSAALQLIAFTPDGRTAVTGDSEGGVTTWDVREAEAVETLVGHGREVSSFALTSDGDTLYSASLDRRVFTWDLGGTRRLGRRFRAGVGSTGNSPRYAMSADGRLIAFGQENGAVSIVDARTLARRRELPVGEQVLGMAFVPGSHLIVAGDPEGFLSLADADSGSVLWRIHAHDGSIWTPGVSADGRLLVTGSQDRTVHFWSLPDGRRLGAPLTFQAFPTDVQLSPDGRLAAVALFTRLELWDVRTRRRVRSVKLDGGVDTARFSPSGRLIALSNSDGAQVWSTEDWTPITRVFSGHAGPIHWDTISRDDRTLATSGLDGTVRLWDIESEQAVGAPLPGLPGHQVIGLLTPDSNAVIAGYDTGQAYRWDIRPATLARQACLVAGRTLTRAEWDEFLPGRDFKPACTD